MRKTVVGLDGNEHIAASRKIGIGTDHHIMIYVWDSIDAMQEYWGEGDFAGRWHMEAYYEDSVTGKRVEGQPYLGSIHLCHGHMSIAVVFHEIQHFILDWILINQMDLEDDDTREAICKLAGDLTYEYSNWFWEELYDGAE